MTECIDLTYGKANCTYKYKSRGRSATVIVQRIELFVELEAGHPLCIIDKGTY